jgi:hypothetical protein
MHRDVVYQQLDPEQKRAAALSDLKGWLGTREFNRKTKQLRQVSRPDQEFWLNCCAMLSGVQGYPAIVWYEHIWNHEWEYSDEPASA